MSDAAAKTEAAADALLDWLRTQPTSRVPAPAPALLPLRPPEGHAAPERSLFDCDRPDEEPRPPVAAGRLAWSARARVRPGHSLEAPGQSDLSLDPGRASAAAPARPAGTDAALRLRNTDWLHHRMIVSGPAGDLAHFRLSAGGAGIIPWHLDLDRMAEDFFHLLVAPPAPQQRTLSLAGARIVADQLRAAVARRHGIAVAGVGRSRACPFDLHAVVPVPTGVLALGPDDPAPWTGSGPTGGRRSRCGRSRSITTRPPQRRAPGRARGHCT